MFLNLSDYPLVPQDLIVGVSLRQRAGAVRGQVQGVCGVDKGEMPGGLGPGRGATELQLGVR